MSRALPAVLLAVVVLVSAAPSLRAMSAEPVRETAAVPAAPGAVPLPAAKPAAAPADDANPMPEYPSDGNPSPQGAPGGPTPLLANAITEHGFNDAWSLGYRGQGVRVAVVDQGVDFGNLDLQGTEAKVTNPASPYDGWPIAYDPLSLRTYLTTGWPDGTWYANTTRTGLGPFVVTHTIKVDGTNDFGDREKVGTDPIDQTSGGASGYKADFDLTDLYATRDDANWYFGFPVYVNSQNASFVLMIDVDNETSGAYVAPFGTVDTNTSASDRVTDVAWSPDGTKVAVVSSDRLVRIWTRTGTVLFTLAGHTADPLSVAWSPDGTKVASQDKDRVYLWNAVTGALVWSVPAPTPAPATPDNGVLAFSANGTWVAAATNRYVHFFDAATGAKFGTLWASTFSVNAVSFHPIVADRIAVATEDPAIKVYTLNATNVKPGIPATPAVPLFTLTNNTQSVLDVAWSPDGDSLASGARDSTVRVFDANLRTLTWTRNQAASAVLSVAWSPDGTRLVAGSEGIPPAYLTPASFLIYDSAGNLVRQVTQRRSIYGVDWSSLNEVLTGGGDLTARLWTPSGDPIRILVAHRADYALYVRGFTRYSDRESKYVPGMELARWYTWDPVGGRWNAVPLAGAGGRQASLQLGATLFNEFAVPRALFGGDPSAISMELFSTSETGSRAQDTTPSDRGADFRNLDFSPGWNSLGAFAYKRTPSYRVSGITSASDTFHFGFHPGPAVQRKYGSLGVLVVDATTPGVYDTVYLDMNGDNVFDPTDVRVTKADPIAAIDNYNAATGAPGQDGYPDVSAGMVYFISDGVNPIPYSRRLASRAGLELKIPAAGNLVAFAGDFGVDPATTALNEHGTRVASEIVAQGRLPSPLVGTANNATLIAIMNGLSDPVEAWTFAVEGYDGLPNTGDEAQVVVSAFNYPTIPGGGHEQGWDRFSRTADVLSTKLSDGNATFVASAGDYGSGYGTVLSPAGGPNVIAVGRAGDFSLRTAAVGGVEGPNPHWRDAATSGSRGPTASGFAKPELLAVDTASVSIPLHAAPDGSAAISASPMVGSDVSAGIVAGAVAVIDSAFFAAHSRMPKIDEVRAILLSGADDTGYDVLQQGAGFLNVSRSVRLALGSADAGLLVSPSTWHAGDYRGQEYEAFTNLMVPGATDSRDFAVRNVGSSALTADASVVAYTRIGGYTHTNVTRQDAYEPQGDLALWVNDTGLWKVDGSTFTAVRVAAPVPGLWSSADLVKVTAYSNLSLLIEKADVNYLTNYSYALKAYDWGIQWMNWPPGLGPFPWPATFPGELNTVGETQVQSNVLEVRAAFPATALHDGLVISLESRTPLTTFGLEWTFEVEFYQRTPWPWASLAPSGAFTVPPQSSSTITATVTVPPGTYTGSYEAAILVRDTTHGFTTTIPVLVNVGSEDPQIAFGGNLLSTDLYDNSRMFGGYDRTMATTTRLSRPSVGDWRYYFFDIPSTGMFEAPVGYKVLVNLSWIDAKSDIDIFAFGRTVKDAASNGDQATYGPYPLKQVGKSEELDKPDFKTTTGGGSEIIAYDLASGLNVIALHAFSLRGLEASVRLLPSVAGWVNVPSSINVGTRNLAGRTSFSFRSNLGIPGLRAAAVGPAQTTAFTDLQINQTVQAWWNFPTWGEWMYRANYNFTVKVERALILDVHIEGQSDVNDLDLGVFRDTNGDGLVGPEEYTINDCTIVAPGLCLGGSVWNYNADADADEEVKWVNPPDGTYIVKVLGYDVPSSPGHFNMQIAVTLATGKGYEIPEAPKPAEIVNGTTPLPPLTRVTMNMTWDFPNDTKDDAYGGAVQFGLPNAPGVVVVPVTVLLDRVAPEITGFKVNAPPGRLNVADNRTTNDPQPQLAVSVQDLTWGQLDPLSARLVLDGEDLTSVATIGISYIDRGGKLGMWEGTLALSPPTPLGESSHTLNATIADLVGNVATASFTFSVDETAPSLSVLGAPVQYTRAATYTLAGTTDRGAWVNVRGAWYEITNATGTFSLALPLLEGANPITIVATDWFGTDASGSRLPGNTVSMSQTIVRDVTDPEILSLGTDPGGLTQAASVAVTGQVRDFYAAQQEANPRDLVVTLDGTQVPVLADGTFRVVRTLTEGANTFTAMVTDQTGNTATRSVTVTRDTTPPALQVSVSPGTTVTTNVVTVMVTTESGAFVTINGIGGLAVGGTYSASVAVNPGANVLVVEAQDAAGNVASQSVTVTYNAPAGLGLGTIVAIVAVVAVAAALAVFFLIRRRGPKGEAEEGESAAEEAPPEETAEEAPVEEELAAEEPAPEAEEPAEEELPPEEDPRVARLRQAYEEGRISKEVYEQNLQRIRGSGGA